MKIKPTIFLESHNISNMFGGFGQFNYWLIKNLIQNNEDFNFTVTAKSKHLVEEFLPDVDFKKYIPLQRKKIFRIRKKYDLWHSLNQNSKIEPFHKTPYVMTIHDVIFMEEGLMTEKEKQDRIQRLQTKIERSNAIVYISEYAKNSTNKYFTIPDRVEQHVIYNGTPLAAEHKPVTIQNSTNPNKPFLFTIGQFREKKNFHTLIGMLSHLKDFQLVIAGDYNMSYKKVIQNEIEKYKLGERVFFPGKISEEEKHYYFQNCHAFVFPSLHEGFGLPPLEAMTYGKPVFLANRTSLPEIGGEQAFYWDHFDPEYMATVVLDGLESSERDPEFTKKIIAHAAKFNWSQTANKYLDVYKSIINP
ncbi:MAG: glycosyltransferase family 4 protein [Gillisia sp.]|nr:glycosyltransferase family 4 protein [Gillisia sp.]